MVRSEVMSRSSDTNPSAKVYRCRFEKRASFLKAEPRSSDQLFGLSEYAGRE
jgi:hypothetical protein